MSSASENLDQVIAACSMPPWDIRDHGQVATAIWRHATRRVEAYCDGYGLFRVSIVDATTEKVTEEKFGLHGRLHDQMLTMVTDAVAALAADLDDHDGDDERCQVAFDDEGTAIGIRCHHRIEGDVMFTRDDLMSLLSMGTVLRHVPAHSDYLVRHDMVDVKGMYVTLTCDGRTQVHTWLEALG